MPYNNSSSYFKQSRKRIRKSPQGTELTMVTPMAHTPDYAHHLLPKMVNRWWEAKGIGTRKRKSKKRRRSTRKSKKRRKHKTRKN